jgi:hypothetical protein
VVPAVALEVTQLYMQQYTHAAPFNPVALVSLWERCGKNPRGIAICEPGLHAAERLLLGDRPPDPSTWLYPEEDQARAETHQAPEPEKPPAEEAHEGDDL